jgi:hypothetical protein
MEALNHLIWTAFDGSTRLDDEREYRWEKKEKRLNI